MKPTLLAKRYYRTLGLSCDAKDEEIREAYYKLAFKHHPDRNPGDVYAAARFKKIQIAYEGLSRSRVALVPPSTAEQFPFLTPVRSRYGSVWEWLAPLGVVAAMVVLVSFLLRAAPRIGGAITPESRRIQLLPNPHHLDAKLQDPAKLPHIEPATASGRRTAKRAPGNSPIQRSDAGLPQFFTERRAGEMLGIVGWNSPESFVTSLDSALSKALDAVSSRPSYSSTFTENWPDSPGSRGTTEREPNADPKAITQTVSDNSNRRNPQEDDQQMQIEEGMIRFGSPKPASLEAEFAIGALQIDTELLEPVDETPRKWNGERHTPILQEQLDPIEHMLHYHGSEISSNSVQLPKWNRHSLRSEVIGGATYPNFQGPSDPADLESFQALRSTKCRDVQKPSPMLPVLSEQSRSRQEEKYSDPLRTQDLKQWWRLSNPTLSTKTADALPWEKNARAYAGQQSVALAAGAHDNSGDNRTLNRYGRVERDLSIKEGGANSKPLWNSQKATGAGSNLAIFPASNEGQVGKDYFSPITNRTGPSQGNYSDPSAVKGNRLPFPAISPYGSGPLSGYPGR